MTKVELTELFKHHPARQALDVATGHGGFITTLQQWFHRAERFIGVDSSAQAIERAKADNSSLNLNRAKDLPDFAQLEAVGKNLLERLERIGVQPASELLLVGKKFEKLDRKELGVNAELKTKLLEGLKEAMIAERSGIEFFTVAAAQTIDPQGREVFENLAREEAEHLVWLRRQYGHLWNDEPLEKLPVVQVTDLEGDHPIFSKELRLRLKTAHFEMTALSVGQQLEQSAIDRYRRLAEEAGYGELRDFYLQLMAWEQSHAGAFSKQAADLREEYWTQNNFAPF